MAVGLTISMTIRRFLFGAIVTLGVKGHEEQEESDQDKLLEPEHQSLVIPTEVAKTTHVGHRDDRNKAVNELDELSLGEVSLPSRGSSHGGHQVTPVHQGVDKSISDHTVVQEEHSSLKISESQGCNDGVVL